MKKDLEQDMAQDSVRGEVTLGRMLREARERKGLTPAELAGRINLDARLVESLERDAYEGLPDAVFLRGYLRRWAPMLELDESRLLAALDRAEGPKRSERASARNVLPGTPVQMDRPRRSLPWGWLLLILALPAGYFASTYLPESGLLERFLPGQEPITPVSGEPRLLPLPPPPSLGDPPPPLTPPLAEPTPPVESNATSPAQSAPLVSSAEAPVARLPALESPAEPEQDSVAPGAVVLRTSGAESWVEVTDGTGKRLVYDTLKAGAEKRVEGKPPYDIFLGNASAVEIMYEGKTVDTRSHRRASGTARLSLGK
ncbi:MAG: RodZ domain-containing protein [Pseudomonadota bacterium]